MISIRKIVLLKTYKLSSFEFLILTYSCNNDVDDYNILVSYLINLGFIQNLVRTYLAYLLQIVQARSWLSKSGIPFGWW